MATYHLNVGYNVIRIKGYLILRHSLVVIQSHSRDAAISSLVTSLILTEELRLEMLS